MIPVLGREVEEGQERIRHQTELVERLRADGHATHDAERCLRLLRDILQTWKEHRELIVLAVARFRAAMS